ncbi:hypothetical protein QBC35DRAFT_554028, partial [Podospora australis]
PRFSPCHTLDVAVQASAELLSVIWAPLRIILQASSNVIAAFDGVVEILADIGMTLPTFERFAALFPQNENIRRALCLFFEHILDLYSTLLKFVSSSGLQTVIEAVWPSLRLKVGQIKENMERHKLLTTANVTLEEIVQADDTRKKVLKEIERAEEFRDQQTFTRIRRELQQVVYATQATQYPATKLCRLGKTYITAHVVKRLQDAGQRVFFAFLSYEDKQSGEPLPVLHSLLLQAVQRDSALRLLLYDADESDHDKLVQDISFVQKQLRTVLECIGLAIVVLDGLDELDEKFRGSLLTAILESYITDESKDIRREIQEYGADEKTCKQIMQALQAIAAKAEGTFLYAKLMMDVVEEYRTPEEIQEEMNNLPDGLDQA